MPSRLQGPVRPTISTASSNSSYTGPTSPAIKQPPPGVMQRQRTSSPDTTGRGSFSSVREHDSGLAQSFTSSKISSYADAYEEAIDGSGDIPMAGVEFVAPVTRPQSKLLGAWYPQGTNSGWKDIQVKGRHASRSYSDLQALHRLTALPPSPSSETPEVDPNSEQGGHDELAGLSAFELLPTEILSEFPPFWS